MEKPSAQIEGDSRPLQDREQGERQHAGLLSSAAEHSGMAWDRRIKATQIPQ